MSGNDQPPVPPQPPGSAPDDEPTPVEPPVEPPQGESIPSEPSQEEPPQGESVPSEPPAGEPGFVMQPPPGQFGAQPPPPGKNNKGLIIGVAVAAAIIVVGGIVGAIALISNSDGNDKNDNKKDESSTSSVEDFCDVIKKMDASEDTAGDPTIVSDALRDAGTPKDMADDEKDGRDLLIKIGDDAKDGPAAEKAVTDLNEDDTAKVQAFITYIGKACAPTASETPSTGTP